MKTIMYRRADTGDTSIYDVLCSLIDDSDPEEVAHVLGEVLSTMGYTVVMRPGIFTARGLKEPPKTGLRST